MLWAAAAAATPCFLYSCNTKTRPIYVTLQGGCVGACVSHRRCRLFFLTVRVKIALLFIPKTIDNVRLDAKQQQSHRRINHSNFSFLHQLTTQLDFFFNEKYNGQLEGGPGLQLFNQVSEEKKKKKGNLFFSTKKKREKFQVIGRLNICQEQNEQRVSQGRAQCYWYATVNLSKWEELGTAERAKTQSDHQTHKVLVVVIRYFPFSFQFPSFVERSPRLVGK